MCHPRGNLPLHPGGFLPLQNRTPTADVLETHFYIRKFDARKKLEEGSEVSNRTSISCEATQPGSCGAGGELMGGTLFRPYKFLRGIWSELHVEKMVDGH